MKPSDKIREILLKSEIAFPPDGSSSAALYIAQRAERTLNAIIEYLDEEYEKGETLRIAPCIHLFNPYQFEGGWGASTPPPTQKCSKCGLTK